MTPVLRAATVLALTGVALLATSVRTEPTFSHRAHERLFPVCEGCHAGVLSGRAAAVFPQRADCDRCHDGTRAERVSWQPRPQRVSNLRFSHPDHVERTSRLDEPVVCASCHAADGEPSRMNIGAAQPERCMQCHEHAAPSHLDSVVQCARCHVPLTAAIGLTKQRVARLPQPPSHTVGDFVSTHGTAATTASCTICHARESCERCHANADRITAITALAADTRVAAVSAALAPAYPRPATHDADWAIGHGPTARVMTERCANCHTQPSCTGCHRSGNAVVAALPAARVGAAPGVTVQRAVHAIDIATRHAGLAATGRLECSSCHTREACSACHAGSDSRAFHLPNFVERHAAEVFSGGGDCQSCHNTETFCRDCHMQTGVAAQERMSAAFHTAQPMWVLSHGQAARTSMEACASCHRQNDCVRCHSAAGGWGVNPHGPGFAARRLGARNAATCRWCHLADPVSR